MRMKRPGDADQYLSELGKDSPIMRFVSIGQRRARHFAAEPHVVQFASQSAQAGLDIAQALAISELRKGHRQYLVPTGKSPEVRVAVVASDTLLKFFFGEMLDELRENGASRVHPSLFHPVARRKDVNPAPFQFKSFLLRPRVIGLSSIS